MSEEEFEKQTLNNLITDLKDIDKYATFKNGAFIYDLGKYQGTLLVNHIEQLQQENKQLKEEIKKILKELEDYIQGDIDGFMTINEFGGCNDILEVLQNYIDKIQELKEKYK